MNSIDEQINSINTLSSTHKRKTGDDQVNDETNLIKKLNDENNQNNNHDKYKKQVGIINYFIRFSILFLSEIHIFLIAILSVYLYILSLEGCHETQTFCLVNLNPQFFHNILIFLTISSFINAFLIFLTFKKKIQNYHLFYTSLIFSYLTLFYDTGADLAYHGQYNRSLFVILLIVFIGFISLIYLSVVLLFKKYFKLIFIFFAIFCFLIIYVPYKLKISCTKWNNGLNNKKVINNESDSCNMVSPSNCWIELMDGLLDISWLLNEGCDKFRPGEKTELMKYLNQRYSNSSKFGYPITTSFNYSNGESHHGKFNWNVFDNFIDIDNPQNNNLTNNYSKPEIILEFDRVTNYGSISINITKNKTLVKQRKEIAKKSPNVIVENILFIYVDSISRQHFIRKMKKTNKFIEKHFNQNNTFNAYQFMKYQAFIFFTQPNANPMFYGQSMYHNNGTHIVKNLKDKGFITAQANNICSRELYDIQDDYIENLNWEPFDHENIALFCDPNYNNPENPFTPYMGPYSIKKRCLYGKQTFEYVLNYGEEFWKTYVNERKFLRLSFQDAHEGTGEVVSYLDEQLFLFLKKFEKNNWLNNTAIFFVSDHGNNMIGFYNILNAEDFVMEKTLASLFILLPNTKDNVEKYHENIISNEQTYITPYDIYNTILSLIGDKKNIENYSDKGQDLLENIPKFERNCEKYSLDLNELWCRCKKK